MAVNVCQQQVWENGTAVCMARIIGINGVSVTQARLAAITIKVSDIAVVPFVVIVPTTPITISQSIFDVPVVDGRWTLDAVGYSFIYTLSAMTFPIGNHKERVEFWFTAVTGEEWPAVFDLIPSPILYGP